MSDEIEDGWLSAKKEVSEELSQWGPGRGRMFLVRDGLIQERRRLSGPAPVMDRPFPVGQVDGGVNGVSLFGRVYCPEKLREKNAWAFRISDDKRLILGDLPGNRYGTRFVATGYGDVVEIPEAEARKKYGLSPMCHPSRVFILSKRKY